MNNDVSLNDIHRLKGILRAHSLHEEECSRALWFQMHHAVHPPGELPAPCNCFVSEDPFDMEKDPPLRIEGFQNGAEQSRRHRYSDGRVRDWIKKRDGEWGEVT